MPWNDSERRDNFSKTLLKMKTVFDADPEAAVRSQNFIQTFHQFIAEDLTSHLTLKARTQNIRASKKRKSSDHSNQKMLTSP